MIRRTFDTVAKIAAFVVILEPLWMLLPFAGFLYGSILNLEFLKSDCCTIKLLYFVLPVQTFMPLAIVLIGIGIIGFIIGVFQIYLSKAKKSGLVRNGLYKKFRHPQYTALIIFSIGFLLLWGRVVAFIGFFIMIFLYYMLAKKEEQICIEEFGQDYKDYMLRTWSLFPGDMVFSFLGRQISKIIPNKPLRLIVSFILFMSFGLALCAGILEYRFSTMNDIPYSKTCIEINGKSRDFILIEGFSKHINKFYSGNKDIFFEEINESISSSDKMSTALEDFEGDNFNTILYFIISRTVREKKDYYQNGMYDAMFLLINSKKQTKRNSYINSIV